MPVIEAARSNLLEEIQNARSESDRLFDVLRPEALYERPIAERHRVIFYKGHLEAFDYIQICREGLGMKSPEPQLDTLFQAGIDPDSAHLPSDTPKDWPSIEIVRGYVDRCRRQVEENLDHAPLEIVQMVLEHRDMHVETLAYMFHNFPFDLKREVDSSRLDEQSFAKVGNEWSDIPPGEAVLGKKRDGSFGWDNEYEETRRDVPAFRMQRYNVTNGDYLRFVEKGAPMPHFWTQRGDRIYYRGMFGEIPLPLDSPVYVTQVEAARYAQAFGKSLPSEEQFDRAAYGNSSGEERKYPWGNAAPTPERGNFDFAHWDPQSVYAAGAGDSAFKVRQLVGNGWEWTNTPFGPLPGFTPHKTYPGYSANFFDGEHYVLKGGSPRTAARLLRRSFRNWFRRDYPYMYATFRCVEN